ncbi:hypothetical protein [Nocardioides yefusunii]|uniref:VanZ family protein n=1 Tax=Nocardioides yefusunii TaxID=2500546 RepID=A0ABW1QY89_9ACTN|nr:hypothetical protein [Nocardioides yefusunii]
MDDVLALTRIVLRDPLTLVAGVGVALVIGAVWLWLVRGRGWGPWRRAAVVLGSAALGTALAIVLVREDVTFGRPWYCLGNPGIAPGTAEETLNLVLYSPAAFFAVLATRRLLATTTVFLVLVVAVECLQKWIDVGTCEVGDMSRNGVGALLGALAGRVVLSGAGCMPGGRTESGRDAGRR